MSMRTHEGADCGQPQVARGRIVVSLLLKVFQKRLNAWCVEVFEAKRGRPDLELLRRELEEQAQGQRVDLAGPLACPLLQWQPLPQEHADMSSE